MDTLKTLFIADCEKERDRTRNADPSTNKATWTMGVGDLPKNLEAMKGVIV
jgi:hypothetical protein